MGLNKQSGNMYGFVTHTWNPIKGKCYFDCIYCYMKKWGELPPPRLVEKEFNEFTRDIEKEESDIFIFVGSSIDMFAPDIPDEWIYKVMEFLHGYDIDNQFLFQTKDPEQFLNFVDVMPYNSTYCTTIETNRIINFNTPAPHLRADAMRELSEMGLKTMVTVEPVMKFDDSFASLLKSINADQINIGADSQGHKLPEPSKEKLQELINEIKPHQKNNLKRLL